MGYRRYHFESGLTVMSCKFTQIPSIGSRFEERCSVVVVVGDDAMSFVMFEVN